MIVSEGGVGAAITARMQAAAEWLQCLDDIDLSDEQVVAWLDWYNSSEENRRVFDELQAVYLSCKNLRPEHRLLIINSYKPPSTMSQQWRVWVLMVGIALLAAALGAWWCLRSR